MTPVRLIFVQLVVLDDRLFLIWSLILALVLVGIFLLDILPWTKKRTIREICGEKNAVPSSDIMLDNARSAQGKSLGLSRA